MAYKPTPEQIKMWMGDSSQAPPELVSPGKELGLQGFLKKINAPFKWLNEETGITTAAAHAGAAPLHFAENIANAPGAASNFLLGTDFPEMHVPEWLDPSKNPILPDNPTNRAAGMLGELAGGLATGSAEYKALEKLLGFTAKTPLYARALLGAGEGAASTSSEGPGGRGAGAVIGGVLPVAAGVTKSTIGKRGAEIHNEAAARHGETFENVLMEGNKSGVSEKLMVPSKLTMDNKEVKKFFKHSPSNYNASIKRFINEPSLNNAHEAQSDLSKIERHIQAKKDKGQSLSNGEHAALKTANELKKRMRGSLQSAFMGANRNDLAQEYGEAIKGFAKEVGPYRNPEMSKFIAGKGSSKKAGKELIESNKFAESDAARELPGYQFRRSMQQAPGWAKASGIGATAATLPALMAAGVPIPYYIQKLLEGHK